MPDPVPTDDAFAPTKAIFTAEFHWSRTNSPLGFGAKASPEPQSFPRDFIAAAIAAGRAMPVPAPAALKAAKPPPAAARAAPARKD
ncbi:MAG: hypothetical protein ACRCSU_12195 [Paracoccaceae bacterium]